MIPKIERSADEKRFERMTRDDNEATTKICTEFEQKADTNLVRNYIDEKCHKKDLSER